MNILGIYCKSRVIRLAEDIFYLDSSRVDKHRYNLIETTYIGFLRRRICRYYTSLRYLRNKYIDNRELYEQVINPWLRFNDQPLHEYLTQKSAIPIDNKLSGSLPSRPKPIVPLSLASFPFVQGLRKNALTPPREASSISAGAVQAKTEHVQLIEKKTSILNSNSNVTVKVTVEIST